ncbi:MAG: FemAB family PEP-CTERM system-associated protein [Calditrichaeota bacterium]|nr:MAG: FemAB family PEP-CTERM system-associated protein [Calditrichota bacterium]MBL1206356.1 FemAB family PEP-CTERM system-associated protein [Calditrichota bacterium]NOG46182.1 FemAB family PEP-CTERM system-associated protein [Calditrichota bacterium]
MQVHYLDGQTDQWDEYVEQHECGSVYQKSEWKKIIENHFGKKTFYIYVLDDNQIKGVLPLILFKSKLFGTFIISVPYVNYGGMLYSDKEAEKLLKTEAEKIRKETDANFVELRNLTDQHTGLKVKTQKVTFFLDLPDDEEELFKSFKSKLRSQIRRPLKEEMYSKVGGIELLDEYYSIFCRNMRDLGTPVYSKNFFKTILEESPNNSNLVIVYTKEHKAVASAFIIGSKERMEIPWASTLREYNRLSPNMLLYWDILRFSISKGYKQFDFGRCSKDSGTYKFKKQWGAIEQQLYWYYLLPEGEDLPEINPNNPKYKLAISLWQKMPLFMTKIIGPHLVKNLP